MNELQTENCVVDSAKKESLTDKQFRLLEDRMMVLNTVIDELEVKITPILESSAPTESPKEGADRPGMPRLNESLETRIRAVNNFIDRITDIKGRVTI